MPKHRSLLGRLLGGRLITISSGCNIMFASKLQRPFNQEGTARRLRMAKLCSHAGMSTVLSEVPACDALANGSSGRHEDFPRWYAVYTRARHEKMVGRHFEERGITHFLPLYLSIHQWNKRASEVSLPLFPGYVFVRTSWHDRRQPLEVPGVVHFVGPAKSPTEIPEKELNVLQSAVMSERTIEPHPYLALGKRVRVASGPMAGLVGVIKRTAGRRRIVISVDMIMRSVSVELDASTVTTEM